MNSDSLTHIQLCPSAVSTWAAPRNLVNNPMGMVRIDRAFGPAGLKLKSPMRYDSLALSQIGSVSYVWFQGNVYWDDSLLAFVCMESAQVL